MSLFKQYVPKMSQRNSKMSRPTTKMSRFNHRSLFAVSEGELTRSELVQLAKGGKLAKYGVTGRSTSADIREALEKQDGSSGASAPKSAPIRASTNTGELTRAQLVQLAKGGKLVKYGVTGRSTSADIRAALAKQGGSSAPSAPRRASTNTGELTRAQLVQLAKGGKLVKYGVTGRSTSVAIRAALAKQGGSSAPSAPSAPRRASTNTGELTRSELVQLAKGGKLAKYGVTGRSTSVAIRAALEKQYGSSAPSAPSAPSGTTSRLCGPL